METTSTVWKLVVFSVILSTGASDNNVCRKQYISKLPVVHMCTEDSVLKANNFFIDAFVSATTATTCTCTLQATSSIEITTSVTIAPDVPCDSEIRINTKHVMNYTCGYETTYASQTVGPEGVSISLRTVVSNKDATYCLNIAKYRGDGTLSLKCYLPYNTTLSATTSTTTDPTQIGSTTPVMTNNPNSEHQQESGSFPVAAAAGGAGGFVLIVVVVVIFVIFLKRKKQSKKADDDPYENEVYVKNDTNPNYPPDPYSTIDDESVSVPVNAMIIEPKVPLKPDNLSSGDYDIISDQPVTASRAIPTSPAPSAPPIDPAPSDNTLTQSQKVELSNMYAKVNKIKPTKTQEDNNTIPQPNDVYAVVDKSKTKQAIKGEGSGDVYAVVQKKKTSAPKPPPGTPGLIYSDLAFDEDEDSPEGAVGGEVNSRVSTNEDSVTYSSVRVS